MNRNIYISTYEGDNLLFKGTTTGLVEDDYLSYYTDSDNIRINLNNFSFTKENEESIIKIYKDGCELFLKELRKRVNILLEYLEYKKDNDRVEIEYKLESQEYPLKIVIEIGDEINEI